MDTKNVAQVNSALHSTVLIPTKTRQAHYLFSMAKINGPPKAFVNHKGKKEKNVPKASTHKHRPNNS